jgi:KAP family P-loop domain
VPNDAPSDSPQSNPGPRIETVAGFSIRDTATNIDHLGFKPYVEAVAAFLTHEETKPPITMSVEGEWGSGKSSFMLMLEGAIGEHYEKLKKQAKIVRFNAWRYDKDEALWAAFALLLTESLAKKLPIWKRLLAHCRLQCHRFEWKRGWFAVVRFAVLTLFLVFTTIAFGRYLIYHPDSINPFSEATTAVRTGSGSPTVPEPDKSDEALLKLLVTGAGSCGYLILLTMLIKKAVDTVGNPFAIDLKKFNGSLSYEEKVSFIEQFHKDFAKILTVYSEGQTVFVFIDDLDRCELPRAADMMQGINLLMSDSCKAVYVLGLDREKIAAGLAAKYEKLFTYLNDQRAVSAGEPNTATQSGLDFGFDFLEKFIQIPYQVPRPTDADIARLFSNSEDQSAAPSTKNVDPHILFETKVDSPIVQSVIRMVAPSFDHNPRRMKQFVNCFRLTAITASRTGLFALPADDDYSSLTVEQLGKMVAICLRWPLLIRDAIEDQSLLPKLETQALRRDPPPTGADRRQRIPLYSLPLNSKSPV